MTHTENLPHGRGVSTAPVWIEAERAGAATANQSDLRPASPASLLSQTRTLVAPALRAAVAELPPDIERVAAYHFGWRDLDGTDLGGDAATWGKGLRSALVLACAVAAGGRREDALSAAVAVELLHNASLIHDDWIDSDTQRRHRIALWAAFDASTAILAGDALFFASIQALQTGPIQHIAAATSTLTAAGQRLIAGERADVEFETRDHVSVPECLAMIAGKTAALIECCCALGALFGGADAARVDAFARYGHHLGLAFQAVDDYLGIWGVSQVTGKPALSDLRRRKRSLPIVYALNARTSASDRLAGIYRGGDLLSDADAEQAAQLVEDTGAKQWVLDYGHQQIRTATAHLASACPTTSGSDVLTTLATAVVDRDA